MVRADRPPPGAAGRLLGLAALVALVHIGLLSLLDARPASPLPRSAAPLPVTVLAPRVPPAVVPPVEAIAPAIAPAVATAAAVAPRAAAAAPPPSTVAAIAPADAGAMVPLPPGDDGEPPPVYATRVPPPAALRFAARINGDDGEAELSWQHDGERYQLALRVVGPSRPLLEQRREGGFDAAGLAPERFVDRRRGRGVGAAFFRRDTGRISFAGPRIDYPAWPGAQDRLAWLPQLLAVIAVVPDPPDELRFFVADARGIARAWVFRALGSEPVDTAAGPVQALKLVREPPRAEDLRISAWLDPAQGHWPVRLEFVVPASGARFELLRTAIGPAPAGP